MPKSTPKKDEESEVLRFNLNERIQHIVLFVTLILLSITGLALKFYDNWLARAIIYLEGGVEMRGLIHRIAAVILMVLSAYHVLYVVFTERGHAQLMALKPTLKDFKDFYQTLKFNVGLSDERPRFDKFDFRQKFQYGAVVAGVVTMNITGLILWFETQSMAVMPKWMLDITTILHGYEGILIFIVILVWHLYIVHLNPEVFPMDKTWLTGKISIERLKEKHFLEYEKLFAKKTEMEEG